jgi:orotidine-5'-phosphate decarboxylase
MLAAARRAADAMAREMGGPVPYLFAVTIPTSMDAATLKEVGITTPLEVSVLHLADLALKAGVDGIVASPLEAAVLRKALGSDFLIMTPGIRLAPQPGDDQKRVATPMEAISAGADLLVMGRSILRTDDPVATVRDVLAQLGTSVP